MPWLWNPEMTNVLMMGLGGGSIQRAYEHYYPDVRIQTVELDPMVVEVAKDYFRFKESSRQKVAVADGRVYLRRHREKYGAIIMDAYSTSRYGSYIPHHLVTREFFELAFERLTENGVLAYNVMGSTRGWRSELVGAVYKTLKAVFPRVYLFPAGETRNVVMLATKSEQAVTHRQLQQRADQLIRQGTIKLPRFPALLRSFQNRPPPGSYGGPVLKDDYAPVHGLAN
jgi:spermidine synthase